MADLGYDAAFLETPLAPPQAPDSGTEPDAVGLELDYMHFTLRMHPTRRLASWVAWNIDGLRLFPSDSISRSGESFRADPRIPPRHKPSTTPTSTTTSIAATSPDDQTSSEEPSPRREQRTLTRSSSPTSPRRSTTSTSPVGAAGGGLLENAVLAEEGLEDRRLTLFAGPVLRDDDPIYRNIVQLPREHWKVVAYRMDGQLRFKNFVLS